MVCLSRKVLSVDILYQIDDIIFPYSNLTFNFFISLCDSKIYLLICGHDYFPPVSWKVVLVD